jgi:hypothetical protein
MLPPGQLEVVDQADDLGGTGQAGALGASLNDCQEPREVGEVADVTAECVFHEGLHATAESSDLIGAQSSYRPIMATAR